MAKYSKFDLCIFDVKMIGVRYQKDGQAQPFVIFHYLDLDSATGNIELKEVVRNYLR